MSPLPVCSTLASVDFSDNNIGIDGIDALAELLLNEECKVAKLEEAVQCSGLRAQGLLHVIMDGRQIWCSVRQAGNKACILSKAALYKPWASWYMPRCFALHAREARDWMRSLWFAQRRPSA